MLQCRGWLAVWSLAVSLQPSGCGASMTLEMTFVRCRLESIKHGMLLERGSSSFSCRSKPADCGYGKYIPIMCSCGGSGRVVFPFVFTKVSFDIKIFTWMTDYTNVMTGFWLCCFYSALFCTAVSLWLCCKLPLVSNSAVSSANFSECGCSSPFLYSLTTVH